MAGFLGIDIGTSGTKSLLCDERGKVLASATAEHPISHPKPLWSEQEPEDWWKSSCLSVREVIRKSDIKISDIKGIGLSGQMHGSVFLDASHQVIRPALLWNDQRTGAECKEIEAKAGGRAALIQMVSNPAFTGFTAPKILWLRNQEPKHFERVRYVLLPKDYIRLKLTGEFATEVSDASGTLLLDVRNRRWSSELLSLLQLDSRILPPCVESEVITGKLTSHAASELGLPEGIPIVGGAGDQAASAVGNGIVKPGILSATMGTSGVIFGHSEIPETHPEGKVHTMCHAVQGAWHQMGVVLSAGGSLQWFRNTLCADLMAEAALKKVDPYELIMSRVAEMPIGAEQLFFLPYLTGERHPHSDPEARGAWVGLTVRHTRHHLARAVVEGATFAMRDCLEIMRQLGVNASQIRLSGGGARSPFWRQLQADIYGQNVALINSQEGPAMGVAILAMVGTGMYRSVPEACEQVIQVTEVLEPRESARRQYDDAFRKYQQLYPALRKVF